MKKLTPAQKETWKPAHLPRHYYPGYVFIPKKGYFHARKIGLTAERVRIDPRFHKTRLLAKEFAELAAYVKLIRAALSTVTVIKNNARLHGLLNRALQYDETHCCGSRKLVNGNLEILKGFNLNPKTALEDACKIEWDIVYHPHTRQTTVHIPSFVPEYYISPPEGIHYCRIYVIAANIDIERSSYTTESRKTSLIPLKKIHFPATRLTIPHTVNSGFLGIIALGITWYKSEKESNKLIVSAIPGPMQIIKVYEVNEHEKKSYKTV